MKWMAWTCGLALTPWGLGVSAQEANGPHLEIRQVLERGDEGPTLLLLPCAGCGAASWQRFMDANADRFRMIAVTLPGYAGTPRPELPLWGPDPVFQENAVTQLSRLIDARELERVHVVGQSFGTHIGMLLAAERPDRVVTLVSVDGSPTNPVAWAADDRSELLERTRATVDDDWALRLQDPEAFKRFNRATRQPADQQKLHHGMFMASDRVSMLHYWRENMLRDQNPTFRRLRASYLDVKAVFPWDPNPDSTLAAYTASVDAVGTPAAYRRVVFWDTSHWVHLDRPRTLGTVIAEHIAGRDSPDVGPFHFGEVERVGDGPRDVILMPCLGCDASAWADFMERNAGRYRMFAVTWPGLGDTPLPNVVPDPDGTPYFDHLMDALELLIDREGLNRPILVGHSAAAVAAVRFAAERPALVGGVVNVDAIVANGDTFGDTAAQRLAWADAEMTEVLRQYDDDAAWRALNAGPASLGASRAAFYERMWLTPPRAHVLAYWKDWLRTDAGVALPHLTVPFLAIHALPDDAAAAAEKRADLQARYARAPMPPGGRVTYIAASGHTIWEYRPLAFDRALAAFVLGTEESTITP